MKTENTHRCIIFRMQERANLIGPLLREQGVLALNPISLRPSLGGKVPDGFGQVIL